MIGYLTGKFLCTDDEHAIIDVSGVGYSVLVSKRMMTGLARGAAVDAYIHTNMRENALELFGFPTLWEKSVFILLTSVQGIGPKSAMAIIGGLEPELVLSAIVRGDTRALTGIPGVGAKIAGRMVTELSDKARKLLAERPRAAEAAASIPPQGASASPAVKSASVAKNGPVEVADVWNEALAALVNLGYREVEALAAIRTAAAPLSAEGAAPRLEDLIRASLRLMSRGI
jgi:Holliday junction DNA helicase RuvA